MRRPATRQQALSGVVLQIRKTISHRWNRDAPGIWRGLVSYRLTATQYSEIE
jgi:hypothetical protein